MERLVEVAVPGAELEQSHTTVSVRTTMMSRVLRTRKHALHRPRTASSTVVLGVPHLSSSALWVAVKVRRSPELRSEGVRRPSRHDDNGVEVGTLY